MRLVTNNIKSRLEQLDSLLDYSKEITEKCVADLYFSKFKREPKSCWGEKRIKSFHAKNIYYQAMNTLKLFRKNKVKTKAGYIYFMTHPKLDGYVKVGSTLDVDYRLKQFNTGCPLRQYKMLMYFITEDRVAVEKLVHETMEKTYLRAKGEWFKADSISKACIEKLLLTGIPVRRIGGY